MEILFFSEHSQSIKEKLRGRSFYDWCIVIYYYAVYHAVLALICRAGFKSKSHLASISALTLIYYHKKKFLSKEDLQLVIGGQDIEGEDIEFVADSKNLRERASYGTDENFELILAKNLQKNTVDFVNKIRKVIENEN